MSQASLISAILFGLAGVAAIVYFCRVLIQGIFPNLRIRRLGRSFSLKTLRQKQNLSQKEKVLKKAKMLLKQGTFSKARPCFEDSFIFSYQGATDFFLDNAFDHNLSVVELLLKQADNSSLRIHNLPIIEELFQRRNSLARLYLETTSRAGKKMARDGANRGWANKEFSRKLKDLKDRLDTNQQSLQTEITKIFDLLEKGVNAEFEQYH